MDNPFRSLSKKAYRIYWIGMCMSSLAIWIQNAAQPWLAYNTTNSPLLLGTVSAFQFTPMLLFSPFSGVLIDRFSKRTLLLITQASFIVTSLIMAFIVLKGYVNYTLVALIALLTGMINAINLPLRQAIISELVESDLLKNAVALYSSVFNLARVVGPAIAGFIMAGIGLFYCYACNVILFSAALLCMIAVKNAPRKIAAFSSFNEVFSDLASGVRYAIGSKHILHTLITLAVTGVFSINYSVLLPVFSVDILHKNEAGFGLLMSVVGIGTFLGAIFVAASGKSEPHAFFLKKSPVFLALIWLIIPFTGSTISYFLLAASGFFYVSFSSTAIVALQLWSDPKYIGRVTSLSSLVLAGTSPFGNLYSGFILERFGVRWGTVACGLAALVCFLLLRMILRKKYITVYSNERE